MSSPVLPGFRAPISVSELLRPRAETRVEHDAIGKLLGLTSESLTHAAFVRCISQHRVLVVDDNVDAAETMVMLLDLSGCHMASKPRPSPD